MSSTRRRWSSASRTAPWTCGTQRSEYGSWTLCADAWCDAWRPEPRRRCRSSAATTTCPGCGRASWYGAANATSVPSIASTDIAAATDAVRTSRSASASSSAPSADISWVPLSSASPSLGWSSSGSRPRSRNATSAGTTWPLTSTWPRPMSGSARWASGARSPDAPTEPCSGHDRVDARLEQRADRVDEQRPAARVAERERVGPQQQHRADDLARERRADARRVRDEQVLLEAGGVLGRDERRREVAEARSSRRTRPRRSRRAGR